jgi:pimeloyl-ACP methyl ester carboxylesterase
VLTTLALAALSLSPCAVLDPARVRSVEARCATLSVPEDHENPDGPVVALFVAVVPAPTPMRPAEALTVLAGGPGGAATEFYAAFQRAFAEANRQVDVLLVDQRGTGSSARMDCPMPEEAEMELSAQAARAAARECLAVLPHDPRMFTTSVAVRDLDAVRQALGYERLHVYGASYGTRVAQHYARRYPEHTASLILDGVVPADVALGPNVPLNAQAALNATFERCARDAGCADRFPDLPARFDSLRARLSRRPLEFTMPHPRTGRPEPARLSEIEVAVGVRLLSYDDNSAALLPLLIHEAAQGRPNGLAAQSTLAIESLTEALALGMHNAVVCTEDAPFVEVSDELRAALEKTYLGFRQVEALLALCELWPQGRLDEDLRIPLESDVPALLLSGELDPVTPPAYAEAVAQRLPRSRHLVAPGTGHGVAASGCAPGLLAQFIRTRDPSGLDASCLERLAPQPFFLDYAGPGP